MRILFVAAPLLGHLFPMVALAAAMRDAGHEMLIATGGEAVASQPSGLFVHDIAPDFDFSRSARRVLVRHPLIARAELAGTAGTRGARLLFGAINDELAPGVMLLVDSWAPDLVVYEPLAVSAAAAAARSGIPAVLHGTSLFDDVELARATAAAMRLHPMTELPPDTRTLSIAPASIVGRRAARPMRPVPYGGDGTIPADLREPSKRPRILVSRSTVTGPGGDLMSAVVDVAAEVDAEFVVVRPEAKLIERPDLPPNVRLIDWLPIPQALPNCAAIVHHGGSGTVLATLAAGVPQLVVTGPGDRRHNAELVAARGAGLAASARQITAGLLRQLISDPKLAVAAGEVRDEIAAMPAPADVIPDLLPPTA
jgi:UDP:flavonoid glycosyltransferase YjiC (YdhE family)